MNALQQKLLSIALEFKKVCERFNLVYYMCGGSLLGAVRHKGFIPWDDDMDFCMPRSDYNKLINLYKNNPDIFPKNINLRFLDYSSILHKNKKYPRYSSIDSNFESNIIESNLQNHPASIDNSIYWEAFIKIEDSNTTNFRKTYLNWYVINPKINYATYHTMGVNIDIFPMESWGENLEEAKNNAKITKEMFEYFRVRLMFPQYKPYIKDRKFITKMLKSIEYSYKYGNNIINNFLINYKKKKVDNFTESIYKKQTTTLQAWNLVAWENIFFDKNDLVEFIDLPFENTSFKAPKNYHNILKAQYKNYMDLPPENERVSPHLSEYINLNLPYKNFKYPHFITPIYTPIPLD